ncbi:uncharacterized protein LOC131927280 [Physella acuta]|uniref:uncharacterized protein LOC131927280 n=1 Tax=Physella acuta TaxID=109671 RepID=UPI0027DBB87B|nr:uncharacterized protein LOC131927280 [Physella acuta]
MSQPTCALLYLIVLLVSVALGLETQPKKTVDDPLDNLMFHPVDRANDGTVPFLEMLSCILDLLYLMMELYYLISELMSWLMKEEGVVLEGVDPSNQRDVIQRFEAIPCTKLCPDCALLKPLELRSTCTIHCKGRVQMGVLMHPFRYRRGDVPRISEITSGKTFFSK